MTDLWGYSCIVAVLAGCAESSGRFGDARDGGVDARAAIDVLRPSTDAMSRGDGSHPSEDARSQPETGPRVADGNGMDFQNDAAAEGGDARAELADAVADDGVASASDAEPDASDGAIGNGCVPYEKPADCEDAADGALPASLRCTGLYGDWDSREIACGVFEYTPAFELWSDGAKKRRFVALPKGARIDVQRADEFRYPVGTQFWKEFRLTRDGNEILGETRLLRKTMAGWRYTTYVWSDDGADALQVNDGVSDLRGTGYTVPTRDQCEECHSGRPDFILGWDLILLGDGAKGVTAHDLAEWDLLSEPADGGRGASSALGVPGDEIERRALGYLHVNCGVSCHNRTEGARARTSGLYLRLDSDRLESVLHTDAVETGINRSPSPNAPIGELPEPPGGPFYDFLPLSPDRSLVLARMQLRNHIAQMPRIGTNQVDAEGVSAVRAWIEHMSTARGYPLPAE